MFFKFIKRQKTLLFVVRAKADFLNKVIKNGQNMQITAKLTQGLI